MAEACCQPRRSIEPASSMQRTKGMSSVPKVVMATKGVPHGRESERKEHVKVEVGKGNSEKQEKEVGCTSVDGLAGLAWVSPAVDRLSPKSPPGHQTEASHYSNSAASPQTPHSPNPGETVWLVEHILVDVGHAPIRPGRIQERATPTKPDPCLVFLT
jgi:hypothetical protein